MKNINPIEKKISKEKRIISLTEPSKLLADFFNGVVIEVEEEYVHEPQRISRSRICKFN